MTSVPARVIKTLLATVTQSTLSLAHLSHNPLLHTLSAHCHTSSPYRVHVVVNICGKQIGRDEGRCGQRHQKGREPCTLGLS